MRDAEGHYRCQSITDTFKEGDVYLHVSMQRLDLHRTCVKATPEPWSCSLGQEHSFLCSFVVTTVVNSASPLDFDCKTFTSDLGEMTVVTFLLRSGNRQLIIFSYVCSVQKVLPGKHKNIFEMGSLQRADVKIKRSKFCL